jgi:hypothetical protein
MTSPTCGIFCLKRNEQAVLYVSTHVMDGLGARQAGRCETPANLIRLDTQDSVSVYSFFKNRLLIS